MMTFKNIKWLVVGLTFLFLLSVFYGFQFYQQKQTTDELLFKLLHERDQIKEVEVNEEEGLICIDLEVEYVDDLYLFEKDICQDIEKVLGHEDYRINFKDKRNQELNNIYYRVHYSIQEGALKGNFARMSQEVESIMEEFPVEEYRLVVGEDYLYFQVAKGSNYLYEKVPRFPTEIETVNSKEEGDNSRLPIFRTSTGGR